MASLIRDAVHRVAVRKRDACAHPAGLGRETFGQASEFHPLKRTAVLTFRLTRYAHRRLRLAGRPA
jgi:hypothetical protein